VILRHSGAGGARVNKMSEGVGRTWTFYVEISTTSAY
jgi:hypothetical protein